MGTPNEDTWPGVTSLPDFKSAFPKWPSKVSFFFPYAIQFTNELYCLEVSDAWFNLQDLATVVPTLEKAGVDLLSVSGFYSYTQYSTLSLCNEVYATES